MGKIHLVGTQKIEGEVAALGKDVVARVGAIEADEQRRRIVRDRAGSRNRHAAPHTCMRRRHDMHVTGQPAHGITVGQRIQLGLVQHGSLQIEVRF